MSRRNPIALEIMASPNTVNYARRTLLELQGILRREGETNGIRGVMAAIEALSKTNIDEGFAEAQSIYKTVAGGKVPLAEYYIRRADQVEQANANIRLDELRDELWRLFE